MRMFDCLLLANSFCVQLFYAVSTYRNSVLCYVVHAMLTSTFEVYFVVDLSVSTLM